MKTKAGTYTIRELTKRQLYLLRDQRQLQKEFAAIKDPACMSPGYWESLLDRLRDIQEQKAVVQEAINIVVVLDDTPEKKKRK